MAKGWKMVPTRAEERVIGAKERLLNLRFRRDGYPTSATRHLRVTSMENMLRVW